jgi:hypothetical protein
MFPLNMTPPNDDWAYNVSLCKEAIDLIESAAGRLPEIS